MCRACSSRIRTTPTPRPRDTPTIDNEITHFHLLNQPEQLPRAHEIAPSVVVGYSRRGSTISSGSLLKRTQKAVFIPVLTVHDHSHLCVDTEGRRLDVASR